MDRAELLTELTGDIFAYAMHGNVSEQVVADRLKPEALDQRFADFRALVDLHFVLRDDVVAFVRTLPEHLRTLETGTRTRSRTTNGAVEGRVNWQQTLRRRNAEGAGNESRPQTPAVGHLPRARTGRTVPRTRLRVDERGVAW